MKDIRKTYEETFSGNEREPWEKIEARISEGSTHLIENEHGAALLDWFPESKVLLFIYLFVEKEYRNKGIGKELFSKTRTLADNLGAKTILFETELPRQVITPKTGSRCS